MGDRMRRNDVFGGVLSTFRLLFCAHLAYSLSAMAVIYIIEADNTQHQFPLPVEEGGVVTIGSNADCLVPMPGIAGLSGLHCSITLTGGEYVLKDEGSEGGTLDGERAIASEPMREGVPYAIGAAFLYYYAADAPAVQEAPAEEPLAEPTPVSEYAEAPVAAAEESAASPAAAPVKKKKKKKVATPLQQASAAMASQKRKAQALSAVSYVYVLLVLVLAFYAGMTLRHWVVTGEYLPNFDSSPAKTVKK